MYTKKIGNIFDKNGHINKSKIEKILMNNVNVSKIIEKVINSKENKAYNIIWLIRIFNDHKIKIAKDAMDTLVNEVSLSKNANVIYALSLISNIKTKEYLSILVNGMVSIYNELDFSKTSDRKEQKIRDEIIDNFKLNAYVMIKNNSLFEEYPSLATPLVNAIINTEVKQSGEPRYSKKTLLYAVDKKTNPKLKKDRITREDKLLLARKTKLYNILNKKEKHEMVLLLSKGDDVYEIIDFIDRIDDLTDEELMILAKRLVESKKTDAIAHLANSLKMDSEVLKYVTNEIVKKEDTEAIRIYANKVKNLSMEDIITLFNRELELKDYTRIVYFMRDILTENELIKREDIKEAILNTKNHYVIINYCLYAKDLDLLVKIYGSISDAILCCSTFGDWEYKSMTERILNMSGNYIIKYSDNKLDDYLVQTKTIKKTNN